jgi:hypothetical protein
MNLFSLFIIAGMILWLVKPLRVIVAQRTNRTVKALLVAFPVAYALTLGYRFFWGDRDDSVVVGFTVLALLVAWGVLIGVGTVLERRAASPRMVAPLGPGTHVPGMPTRMGELGAARAAEASRAAQSRASAEHRRHRRRLADRDSRHLCRIAGRRQARRDCGPTRHACRPDGRAGRHPTGAGGRTRSATADAGRRPIHHSRGS